MKLGKEARAKLGGSGLSPTRA